MLNKCQAGSLALWMLAGCAVEPVDTTETEAEVSGPPPITAPAGTGTAATLGITALNPFFDFTLGTNGRACVNCHQPTEGMTINPAGVQFVFNASAGTDALFRLNDGAVSPNADVSTLNARKVAYKMLLDRAVIRIGLPIPQNAEFTLAAVDDPYGYASPAELSLFRRPPPTSNAKFLSTRMWDGREPNLNQQAGDAVLGHAQGISVNAQQMQQIVDLENTMFTAQTYDNVVGDLTKHVDGGPEALATTDFYLGINDSLGGDPHGQTFNPRVFTLFDGFAPPSKPKKG
ncbi:MAG TPA: cytochrome c peroxidase, partial [Kofleriaceae bacterium]